MATSRTSEEQAERSESAPSVASAPGPGFTGTMLQLQRTAGNRAVGRWLQRREVASAGQFGGTQDWTTADRTGNTQRWKDACAHNLAAADSSQYRRIVERRDFYRWFYEQTAARGFTTRWALAAAVVADGARQIADMNTEHGIANETLVLANVQLQGMMREGNQVILDNVMPKLKRLSEGPPLTGQAAMDWDMQVLADEQTLVQPMYSRMSTETREQLEYIARQRRFAWLGAWWTGEARVAPGTYNRGGDVPAFDQPDLQSIQDRWTYGMRLGDRFAPSGTGFDPARHAMPSVGAEYSSGREFARLSTRQALHQLDAWLNPDRTSRTGSGSDIRAIVRSLTEPEKVELLADSSPDGWAYSIQFAQFGSIDEPLVQSAMPAGAQYATAVAAFMTRYRTERRRVELAYPVPSPYAFPM